MNNMINIKSISIEAPFLYLWLKYVTDVDLSVHCARCLIGAYSKRIDTKMTEAQDIRLDEAPAKVYYLCGVSRPYMWVKNFHLAFREKEGATLEYESNGIHIIIENAERIEFGEEDIAPDDPNRRKKVYRTCRNWQFAHKIAYEFQPSE